MSAPKTQGTQGGAPSVTIALYTDRLSTRPIVATRPWTDFVELLSGYHEESLCSIDGQDRCVGGDCPHKSTSKHAGNPMAWAPTVLAEGSSRLDVNVRALTLLALDFDGLSEAQQTFVKAALSPWEHVWHTTHQHRERKACVRFVLLLSRQVHPDQWHRFLPSAISYLGLGDITVEKGGKQVKQPDPTCKNRSRFYYRPSHPKGAPFSSGHVRGRVLDVDEVLRQARPVLPSVIDDMPARPLPEAEDWDLDSPAVEDAIDCIGRHLPAVGRHALALAIGGMLRRAGASREIARFILREGFERGGSTDPVERAKTVDHTYALDEAAAMTGFTRACELMGEEETRELGRYLARASNEIVTRGFSVTTENAGVTNGNGVYHTAALAPAPAVVDLDHARGLISKAAAKRMRSEDRSDKILAILLKRVLDAKALVPASREVDVETRAENETVGIAADDAVEQVSRTLAFSLDDTITWDAVQEILRPSLGAMPPASGESWLALARQTFIDARLRRLKINQERTLAEQDRARRLTAQAIADSASLPPQMPPPPPGGNEIPPPDGETWLDDVTKIATGGPAPTLHNARMFLTNHHDFRGYLRWNEVRKCVEVTGGPMRKYGGQGVDILVAGIQDHLASAHHLSLSNRRDLGLRVVMVARRHSYDPIKDYLNNLEWDGTERISDWLSTYCGASAESQEFLRMVGRRWLISLVARGLQPGCKVDNVLVLEGRGGIGKSMVFEILGGEWFCDTAISLGDKDSRMMAGTYWLCELAEIVAFKRSGHDLLKNFFSSRIDKFRPPYAATFEESPRRCVFVGTTNEESYLGDETGNRKYWVVSCDYTPSGLDALRRDRDQVLAEAVAAFRAGERWHFAYEELSVTEEEAEKRVVDTPAKLAVRKWWYEMSPRQRRDQFSTLTTLDVFERAFDSSAAHAKDGDLQRIGWALKKLGFKRRRDTSGGRQWRYYATEDLINAEQQVAGKMTVITGGAAAVEERRWLKS